MPSKNDLSALKKPETKPILPSNDEERAAKRETGSLTGKAMAGRKPKPVKEKQSNKVTLSFDASEWAKVDKKSGLASKATVIHAHLRNTGFFD